MIFETSSGIRIPVDIDRLREILGAERFDTAVAETVREQLGAELAAIAPTVDVSAGEIREALIGAGPADVSVVAS